MNYGVPAMKIEGGVKLSDKTTGMVNKDIQQRITAAPYLAGGEMLLGLGKMISDDIFKQKAFDRVMSFNEKVQQDKRDMFGEEITFRNNVLNKQVEMANIQSKTIMHLSDNDLKLKVKLAKIDNNFKKTVVNARERRALFLKTRFGGNPAFRSPSALGG